VGRLPGLERDLVDERDDDRAHRRVGNSDDVPRAGSFVEEQHALIGQRKRKKFQLGDRVRVQVAKVDREQRQIDFEFIGED